MKDTKQALDDAAKIIVNLPAERVMSDKERRLHEAAREYVEVPLSPSPTRLVPATHQEGENMRPDKTGQAEEEWEDWGFAISLQRID